MRRHALLSSSTLLTFIITLTLGSDRCAAAYIVKFKNNYAGKVVGTGQCVDWVRFITGRKKEKGISPISE